MKTRACLLALPLVLLGTGGAFTVADAAKAPAPVCNIVKDDTGDAKLVAVPGGGNDDIVSADVASDGKTITGVIRLAALDANDPNAPLGHNYIVNFSAKGVENPLFVAARTYPTGTKFIFGYQSTDPTLPINISYPIGDATGTVDLAKKEIRISAPNAAFEPAGSKLALGTKLLGVGALSYRVAGQGLVPSQSVGGHFVPLGGLSEQFDNAAGGNYVVGTPSCVKPGA